MAGHRRVASDFLHDVLLRDPCMEFSGACYEWATFEDLLETAVPEVVIAFPGFLLPHWEGGRYSPVVTTESFTLNSLTAGAAPNSESVNDLRKELAVIYEDVLHGKATQLNLLIGAYQRGVNDKKRLTALAAKKHDRSVDIPLDQIEWIEGAGNSVRLHAQGDVFSVPEMISELVAKLPPGEFIRIHRSTIVNRAHVAEVIAHDEVPASVLTRSGISLAVGVTFREVLCTADLSPNRDPGKQLAAGETIPF